MQMSEMTVQFLLAVSILIAVAVSTQADCLDIYILTGQSNSLGTTQFDTQGFGPGTHPADARTDFFWSNVAPSSFDPNNITLYGDSSGRIAPLQTQQGDNDNPCFWGPEFGMVRTMFEAGHTNVMVVKVSRGGGGNGFWLPTTGHMSNHLLEQIDTVLTAVENSGEPFAVRGLMYLQGESNNDVEAAAADIRLQMLIENIQTHINTNYSGAAANMYTVVGEIAASRSSANRIRSTKLQEVVAANSNKVCFFETRDLPLKSDAIHFGKRAKLEIGRRYADAFNSQIWLENPYLLAGYSANQGSVNAIPHPIAQGLSEVGKTVEASMKEINDSGTPAWQISNKGQTVSPGYRQTIAATDLQMMFAHDWNFKVTAKVVSGGGMALWSLSRANDPGWKMTAARNVNGFQLKRVNGDELEVGLWGSHSMTNLGPGSADRYHTFELRGTAGSNCFDFYIDDQLQEVGIDLRSRGGIAGLEDALLFNSGLNDGSGGEVYWNEISLMVLQEPTK